MLSLEETSHDAVTTYYPDGTRSASRSVFENGNKCLCHDLCSGNTTMLLPAKTRGDDRKVVLQWEDRFDVNSLSSEKPKITKRTQLRVLDSVT
jgi:hypothetical protein